VRKADKGDRKQEEFEAELLDSLRKGYFDTTLVEVEVIDAPKEMEVPTGGATIAIGSIFGDMFPQKKKKRKLTVKEAKEIFLSE
jgi:ATP-dependent HslUV protease ATP-binding subunit HslU